MAAAETARRLGCPCTVVVPLTTDDVTITKLETLGAVVQQHGISWSFSDSYLRTEVLPSDPSGIYVPPFDHPDVWDGNATIVDELSAQLDSYDAVCCNVGGGGLFCGIMEGLLRQPAFTEKLPKVLAVETVGADSLHQSVLAGKQITLEKISSIATSLGSTYVVQEAIDYCKLGGVKSIVVSDADAAMAAVRFADDERMIIEVACGATIAPLYNGHLRRELAPEMSDEEWARMRVVLVVCGGNKISLEMLNEYREKYASEVVGVLKDHVGEVVSAEENVEAAEKTGKRADFQGGAASIGTVNGVHEKTE